MIHVESLTRSYGSLKAVDDVSFLVQPGEIVGLLGHNGAGKTTIMKMMTGFLEPTSGSITIEHLQMVLDRRAIQARMGYLAENCPLYPDMTVVAYLAYLAALHGVAADRLGGLLRLALERTALVDKAEQQIGTLSRGYRQRVGVAQAILHQPRILILDEPTNGLDPAQIQHMRSLLRELARESTLIISTHILQEVEAVCDRVIIIQQGRKVIDTRLDALRAGKRLLVTIEDQDDPAAFLAGLQGVTMVERQGSAKGRLRLALSGTMAPEELAPMIATAVVKRGLRLYRLETETPSLEKIFREINTISGRDQ
ncbi:ABC transporter ATP-binding protein [Desulfobulbus alkaliphilus]|uniref:ABC transporter ATP-binding protein n=1 Tax=Desulfobulbus alkaliphilus TaxID=869814 RepID=UPI0019666972|nr:ATP-binding cassette domain-containing protein [Desulfobulbus alkaliphilus]MBM9537763.1 ATP-binding cassette domain-containing protein [Desulfobulbus alkaliphilus]